MNQNFSASVYSAKRASITAGSSSHLSEYAELPVIHSRLSTLVSDATLLFPLTSVDRVKSSPSALSLVRWPLTAYLARTRQIPPRWLLVCLEIKDETLHALKSNSNVLQIWDPISCVLRWQTADLPTGYWPQNVSASLLA